MILSLSDWNTCYSCRSTSLFFVFEVNISLSVLRLLFSDFKDLDQLFDKKQFESPVFQRPFQYLIRLDEGRSLTDVNPNRTEGSPKICLTTLLKYIYILSNCMAFLIILHTSHTEFLVCHKSAICNIGLDKFILPSSFTF